MAVGKTEEIVTTVRAILKTLECPICLELLKIPVSAGCGHFFCRPCLLGILRSTYRAPCPLCKRSFTRRSVQEATQRQDVISAAEVLAEICTNLTGVKLVSHSTSIKESDKSVVSAPSKKFKSSNQESKDKKTQKRKSCENEDIETSAAQEDIADQNKDESPSKRTCPDSEGSNEEVPIIDDFLRKVSTSKKSGDLKVVFSPEKTIKMKTYLKHRMKIQKNSKAADSGTTANMNKEISNIKIENENKTEKKTPLRKVVEEEEAKNKIIALKNKTNKVNTEQHIIVKEKTTMKSKISKENPTVKTDLRERAKENSLSPSKKLKYKRCLSKSQNNTSKVNETNLKVNNESRGATNKKGADVASENISNNESFTSNKNNANKKGADFPSENTSDEQITSNRISLRDSEDKSNTESDNKKTVEDSFRAIGLNDTAVSVNSVASPLASKNVSLRKSPGWSRVKKVKKDFKMKRFTSLPVEKNSSNITLKNTSVSDQEPSNISKSECHSNFDLKNKNENLSCSKLEDASSVAVEELVSLPHEGCENVTSDSTVSFHVNQQIAKANEANTFEGDWSNLPSLNKETICTALKQESIIKSLEKNTVNTNKFSNDIEENIVPSVSITSSSVICAKYSDDPNKISSQNILKTRKIICELKNTSPSLNKTSSKINISNYARDNFNTGKKLLYDNVAEINQGPFSLASTNLEEYQNFHAQDEFQYVEQSQQTSQVFNLDFHNPLCDNLRAMLPIPCPPVEKTKVIKRTCFTLDEIQECFTKSSQNASSETLYSVPFLSGQYKLHVGVSDETLNVSVLKVIDPNSESNVTANAVSLLIDKGIQVSNSLFLPTEVVPSSNTGSESSQPDTVDPFPYLSKKSSDCEASNFPPEVSTKVNLEECMDKANLVECMDKANLEECMDKANLEECMDKANLEECINKENAELLPQEKASSISKSVKDVNGSEMHCSVDRYCNENEDLNISELVHFPPAPSNKDNPVQEVLIPNEIEDCQNLIPTSEDHNVHATEVSKQKNISVSENIPCKTSQIDYESSDEEGPFRKLKQCVQKEPPTTGKKLSRLSLKKKSSFRRIKISESSDESDQETSTHIRVPEKEAERHCNISLKKKSPFRRVRKPESSDESDQNEPTFSKVPKDNAEGDKVVSKLEDHPKPAPVTDNFQSRKLLNRTEEKKKGVFSSAVSDVPSTLASSMLSDDPSETNASEILLEIEDLSDKIKSLEEKLKHCDRGEDVKSNKSSSSLIAGSPNKTDSEDSTDLFPQSVPPTPPNCL